MAEQRKGTEEGKGQMTVEEAGRLGGHKGGQRERELVEKGKEAERERGVSEGGERTGGEREE